MTSAEQFSKEAYRQCKQEAKKHPVSMSDYRNSKFLKKAIKNLLEGLEHEAI